MGMIFNLISAAAVINVVLGVLALTKGKNRVNLGFFRLSLLLALWNLFVVMWSGGGIEVAGRINFMVISMIPPAGMYFVMAVYNITTGPVRAMLYVISALAAGIIAYTIGTFFFEPLLLWYDTMPCKLMIFIYELVSLFLVFAVLIYKYRQVQFKQEKIKLRYIITAFLILYAGGMLDLASGTKLVHFPVEFMGNICNVIYAAMIFVAIFRLRLFNIEVLFKNFMSYALTAVAAGGLYFTAALYLDSEPRALAAVYFIITFLLIYFAGRLRGLVFEVAEKIAGKSPVETARAECKKIIALQESEDLKIEDTLILFENHLDMKCAVFVRGGDYYMRAWETAESPFGQIIEGSALPLTILLRYETKNAKEIELLDRFGCDLIMPLVYGSNIIGVLAGKRTTPDISFSQDEIDLVQDMSSTISVYMKAKMLQKQQVEDENLKRIGMMARQMAHEIKNPLAALWGAAQLIEGKSDADKENLIIIKEEMKRLTAILDSWQDFSRELKVEQKAADLEQMILEAVNFINLQGHRASIEFKRPQEKISVSVDREKVKQVMLNVFINAIDAMAYTDKPAIEISIVKKKRFADVKVRDNGPGIKKEDLARVKEPLYTTKPKGSGLGLAICERIMNAHKGALLLESDGNTYTEVTLSIPLEELAK